MTIDVSNRTEDPTVAQGPTVAALRITLVFTHKDIRAQKRLLLAFKRELLKLGIEYDDTVQKRGEDYIELSLAFTPHLELTDWVEVVAQELQQDFEACNRPAEASDTHLAVYYVGDSMRHITMSQFACPKDHPLENNPGTAIACAYSALRRTLHHNSMTDCTLPADTVHLRLQRGTEISYVYLGEIPRGTNRGDAAILVTSHKPIPTVGAAPGISLMTNHAGINAGSSSGQDSTQRSSAGRTECDAAQRCG